MKSVSLIAQKILGPVNFNYLKEWLLSKKHSEIEQKRIALYGLFLKQGDTFFDVGSNMGNRVAPALKCGAKVVAVEPQPLCQAVLRKRYGQKIELVPKALGGAEAVMKMHISDAHTLSSLAPDWIAKVSTSGRFNHVKWDKQIDVPVTTLDKLISTYGQPAFVKIDVEGFELEVLKGLSSPVPCMSIEYDVPESLEKLVNCIKRMQEIGPGYKFNYSVSESAKLAMEEWMDAEAMIQLVQSPAFIKTDFGDVYAKVF